MSLYRRGQKLKIMSAYAERDDDPKLKPKGSKLNEIRIFDHF